MHVSHTTVHISSNEAKGSHTCTKLVRSSSEQLLESLGRVELQLSESVSTPQVECWWWSSPGRGEVRAGQGGLSWGAGGGGVYDLM